LFISPIFSDGIHGIKFINTETLSTVWISAISIKALAFNFVANVFPTLEVLRKCTRKKSFSVIYLFIFFSSWIYGVFRMFGYFYLKMIWMGKVF
jgi:predicted alternative tryptophan synthase beta-subunit